MELMEAIRGRKSIRKYKADPVDDKTLEAVMEAARMAPSWSNSQCWRFVVVRDKNIKAELADSLKKIDSHGELADNPAVKAINSAPVIIVACAQLGKSGFMAGKPSTDKGDYWYMYDVALAMQNLALVAHSLGLGTVTVGHMDAKKAESILGVPEGFCVVSMTSLGYPDQEPPARPRKELSEIVFYDKFDKPD